MFSSESLYLAEMSGRETATACARAGPGPLTSDRRPLTEDPMMPDTERQAPPTVELPPKPVRMNLPQTELAVLARMLTYSEALIDDPARYHTPPEEAAELRRLVLTFAEARERQHAGRGTATEKVIAKRMALAAVRNHARIIRRHSAIPTEAKLALGFQLGGQVEGLALVRRFRS